MTDSLYHRVGGTTLPLDVTDITAAASFEACEPALAVLSAMFAAAIRAELGTGTASAWYAVTSALPPTHRLYRSTDPVGTAWRVDPTATLMRQVKVSAWPLLTVHPEGTATFEQRTTCKVTLKRRWGAEWILGDFEADLTLKLSPVLAKVAKILALTVNHGRHPAYDSGTQQFGEDRGWFSRLAPVQYEAGAVRFTDDEETRFWAASATLESEELVRDLDEGDGSGTSSFGLTAAVGDGLELWPDLVIGDGDYPGS